MVWLNVGLNNDFESLNAFFYITIFYTIIIIYIYTKLIKYLENSDFSFSLVIYSWVAFLDDEGLCNGEFFFSLLSSYYCSVVEDFLRGDLMVVLVPIVLLDGSVLCMISEPVY